MPSNFYVELLLEISVCIPCLLKYCQPIMVNPHYNQHISTINTNKLQHINYLITKLLTQNSYVIFILVRIHAISILLKYLHKHTHIYDALKNIVTPFQLLKLLSL